MNCKIIRDLLPLYHDEVVSEESRVLVEDHLETCGECKKVLEDIRESTKPGDAPSIEQSLLSSFKDAKKRLHYKTVLKIAVSVFCTVAVVSALVYGVFFHETPVPYSEVIRNIDQQINSPLDFITDLRGHKSVSVFLSGDSLFICLYDTFWTRYIVRPNSQLRLEIPKAPNAPAAPVAPAAPAAPAVPGLTFPEVPEVPLPPEAPEAPEAPDFLTMMSVATRVYYFEGRISEFSHTNTDMSKTVLLWEKP